MALQKVQVINCAEIAGPFEKIKHTELFEAFAMKLGNSMRNAGFVYLINHEPSIKTVADLRSKSRDFFTLPKSVKAKYRKVDAAENYHGFTPAEDEKIAEMDAGAQPHDFKESFDFDGAELYDESKYPSEIPGLKLAADNFRTSLTDLCTKLLRCFAIYLNLEDKDFFIKQHCAIEDSTIKSHNTIRTNYYLPISQGGSGDTEIIRFGSHCDWGTVTFLVQDEVGGLEAQMTNGDWIPIPPIKDSLVLNAGVALEIWSGGNLRASYHRVKSSSGVCAERQSFGYFVQPDGDSKLAPMVPRKVNWICQYPFNETEHETYDEYFITRVHNSRAY